MHEEYINLNLNHSIGTDIDYRQLPKTLTTSYLFPNWQREETALTYTVSVFF